MKLLEYKQFNNAKEEKSINSRKVTIASITVLVVIIIIAMIITYVNSPNFRDFMDKYILFKNVSETDLAYINIDTDKNVYPYAYYKYVAILENNKLSLYNSSGGIVDTLDINISTPIFSAKDNYLVVAEKNQQRLYLIKDRKIVWDKSVDGQISRVSVNANGHVSVIVSGTSYKSVITTYAENGTEVFKTFLSNTLAVDADMSKDNKFLSFCELDLSGTIIESKIKTISVEKAKQDPANAIVQTYDIPANELVTDIEYHAKDELLCICDDQVYLLKNGNLESMLKLSENNVVFCGMQLEKGFFYVKEEHNGVNNQKSQLFIRNTSNQKVYTYTVNGIAKSVQAKDGVVALNLGSEVYFINELGWLIKKYTSTQEIRDVVISNEIAGIIYRNKIEFLGL